MGIQVATTGSLEHAQNVVVATCRFVAEQNAPCWNLIESFKLGKGEKSMTVPKVAQVTASDLTDGLDMTDSVDIGLSYTSLTTSEVGLKFILTDKLVRQFNEDVFRVIGRQMGDAMARKRDKDVITLFASLNAGTTLGAASNQLTMHAAVGCISRLMATAAPDPYFFVHHPNAMSSLARSAAALGGAAMLGYSGLMPGFSEEALKRWFKIVINSVPCFQDGNIAVVSGATSGYGAIASKSAMCHIESQAPTVERERDASLRGWEVVMVSDYGCFEIDDTYGFPARYEIGNQSTTS